MSKLPPCDHDECGPTGCRKGLDGAACSSEVPFLDLPLVNITKYDGIGTTCPNGSIVEVWKVKGDTSLHITLRRKLEDGRMSKLGFGLSHEASIALCGLMQLHLYPETNAERIQPPTQNDKPTTRL